jgi:hypothetical protein
MLQLTNLIGFGAGVAGSAPKPTVRYVGQYAFSFAGTTSATATVPAADLLPASPTKQILVFAPMETTALAGLTINGVVAGRICDSNGFMYVGSAAYAGSGPFNVVLSTASSASDVGRITVYEIDNAANAYEGSRVSNALTVTSLDLSRRLPKDAIFVGAVENTTDTVTTAWSGAPEDVDADVGDFAFSAAHSAPATAKTTLAVTATVSAANTSPFTGLTILPPGEKVRGGFRKLSSASFLGTSATFTSASITDYTGLGSFKLIAVAAFEANASIAGISFNGNAMTQIGQIVNTGASPDLALGIFAIDVTPAAPSGNIVVTASANILGALCFLSTFCFYDVGSIGLAQSAQGSATGATVNVDVAEGGAIIAAHFRADQTQTISWSGVQELYEVASTAANFGIADWAHADAEVGRAVQATGSASGQYATIAVALNP